MAMQVRKRRWTLAELDALPEDGNKYELIDGELLVTPPPSEAHESVAQMLNKALTVYLSAHAVGEVWLPRSVVRTDDQQTEPDLTVRPPLARPLPRWKDFPTPLLVVEVLSPSSRRTDKIMKRRYYEGLGIPEYWIVDPESRTILVCRPGETDRLESTSLEWGPPAARLPLTIDVVALFKQALG